MTKPVIILGAGGHAKVLIDALLLQGFVIRGVTDVDPKKSGTTLLGIKILGNDEILADFPPSSVDLVNGIGSVDSMEARRKIFEAYKKRNYNFANVLHPSAIIARDVRLSEGVQVMAGAIVQTGSFVGENTLLNTRASVDHDCQIGAHVHLAPGVILSGGVRVGKECHLGTGATVIQNISIGERVFVGAGSLIAKNIADGIKVRGVPAK